MTTGDGREQVQRHGKVAGTGHRASRGIGRAIMRSLAEDDYRVTGLARKRPADLRDGEEFHCVDLTDFESTRAMITELAAEQTFY
uniref:NAD-dependent epimerase/dehydratase family protein n=1 Tax=Cupriavidus yeoncheonensis TaxID=1462994 RepID=UPI003F494570